MAEQGASGAASGSGTQTFGLLTIERRVLLTPSRTIAIPNISNISVGTNVESRSALWIIGALSCFSIALAAFFSGQSMPLAVIFGLAAVGLFIVAVIPPDKTHYLIISTNDGTRSLFTSPKRETLDAVRGILSDKIDAGDEAATYTINFDKGTIENLTLGNAQVSAGQLFQTTSTTVQGDNNQLAVAPGARAGTVENTFTANQSPGAIVGMGNVAQGTTVNVRHVDYARFLPKIEEWQRFYAQHAETRQLAERLSELELLMRSGTPTAESQNRVRSLASELSHVLQGYPPAVQLFEAVLRALGG